MAVMVMRTGDSSGALSPRLAAEPLVIPASQGFAFPGTETVSAKAAYELEGWGLEPSSRMAVPETWLSGRKQPPAKRLGG